MATALHPHQILDLPSAYRSAEGRKPSEERAEQPTGMAPARQEYRELWRAKYEEARARGISRQMARYQAHQRVLAARAADCGIRL